MTRHLFIGGANDGTTHFVEPDVTFHRLEKPRRDDSATYELFDAGGLNFPEVEVYRREKFAIGNRIAAQIFVYQHLSTEGMFECLISGYRQGIPADPGEAYEAAFKRGYTFGVLSAVKAIEADSPTGRGGAPMWDVFRERCYGLIKALLK